MLKLQMNMNRISSNAVTDWELIKSNEAKYFTPDAWI